MRRLIECVPNFSEGRDHKKIEALVAAMSGIKGARVLDVHSDPDHNRSVVTLAGEPEPVTEAALRGMGKAAELIDLRHHRGGHPRIGATDVLPFVPVEGVTMENCVKLARHAGAEIWARYDVPVYFYEEAALRPERKRLESVRSGEFEYLRDEVLRNADRAPDIGGPRLHPSAGAVAVGARKFLIAYNINLDTPDVSAAKKIARTIRASNGGLPHVKAIGVELKDRKIAQVSLNLTDFEQTSIRRVFEPCGLKPSATVARSAAAKSSAWCRAKRSARTTPPTCSWKISSRRKRSSKPGWKRGLTKKRPTASHYPASDHKLV
jgi:glutamate formiminotransferase